MKKLFCLLMALIMMLAFTACTFPWDEAPDDPVEDPSQDPSEDEDDGQTENPGSMLPGTEGTDGPIELPILPVV